MLDLLVVPSRPLPSVHIVWLYCCCCGRRTSSSPTTSDAFKVLQPYVLCFQGLGSAPETDDLRMCARDLLEVGVGHVQGIDLCISFDPFGSAVFCIVYLLVPSWHVIHIFIAALRTWM